MSYLVDSHVLLWWLEDSPRIGAELRETLAHYASISAYDVNVRMT